MHHEEIVRVRSWLHCPNHQSDSRFLGVFELLYGVWQGPAVPVFEDQAFVLFEEGGYVGVAWGGEEVVEAGVGGEFVEDFERGGGCVG